MSKLGFWVAVSVVSLGAAVGAWYYKYQLYGWLPSTASSELKGSSSKSRFHFDPQGLLTVTLDK